MTGRLIEADKAIEATWEQPTYTDPLNVLTEVRERIRELPTVDAIPIEWIQKKIQIIEETGDFYSSAVLVEMIEGWRTKNDTAD